MIRDAAKAADGTLLPRLEFRGEFLHAFIDTERVKSNQPVTLIRGSDKFTSDAMDYDSLTGIANLQGRVHGLIMPPPSAMAPAPKR